MANLMQLSDKKKRFAETYMANGCNATQAAIEAGYAMKTAESKGSQLLRDVKVQELIQVIRNKMEFKVEIKREQVIQEIANIAFADLGLVCDWDGSSLTLKDSSTLKPEHRRMIDAIGIKNTEHGPQVQIKLSDRLKALELLAKHLGILDGTRVSGANKDVVQGRLLEALGGVRKTQTD